MVFPALNRGALLIFSLSLLIISCNKPMNAQNSSKPLKQGIVGQLVWLEGNLMPSTDPNMDRSAKGQTVQREVHIYEITKTSETTREETFYEDIQTKLVKTVMSDKNGIFKAHLEPGKYSVFVKEPKGLFANTFDGYGNIMPVEVFQDEITEITIEINYMAAY